MYEQLPLHFISRAIFQETMTKKQLARQSLKVAIRQLIANLTWRRFSFNRSYTAPVAQLEGLSGKKRWQRIRVLSETRNVGARLTVVCIHLEGVIYTSLLLLLWMLIPVEVDVVAWFNKEQLLAALGTNILYFIGVAVIAPFYVVSGFLLYLNRRTHLEGWDIELAFKRIRDRLTMRQSAAVAASLLLTFAVCTGSALYSHQVNADESESGEMIAPSSSQSVADSSGDKASGTSSDRLVSKENAAKIIQEVLAHEDFGKKEKKKTWRIKERFVNDEPKSNSDVNLGFMASLIRLLADIGYFLMWAGLAALIIFVVYQFPRWKAALDLGSSGMRKKPEPKPEVMFGLEVTEESLPDNIPEEAWKLFLEQNPRQALSLLYRGSLSVLINEFGLILRDSDTEGECAEKVTQHHSRVSEFFNRLTNTWIYMAYGHLNPSENDMQYLCNHWQTYFREPVQ